MKRNTIVIVILLMILFSILSGIIYYHKHKNESNTSDEIEMSGDVRNDIKKIDGWIINNTLTNITLYANFIAADLHIPFDDIRIKIRSNENSWSNVAIKRITTRPYPESYKTNNDTYFDTGEMVIIGYCPNLRYLT